MKSESLLAVVLLVTAATTPGIAATNEAPLADAGLDQTVTRGTTVYLDATGSRDPDGDIDRYRWTITGESGDATNTTTAECPTCEQTTFQAEATGTYRVTLEVTDDDGATTTDTLYVTVEPGEGPTTSLAGPSSTTTADPVTFTVDTDAGAAPLDHLVWKQNGNPIATASISGDADTSSHTFHFPTADAHDVSVVAVDEDGQRDTATKSITVTDPFDPTHSDSPGAQHSETAQPPTVLGPRVVTGHDPLTARYELSNGASGSWVQDGQRVHTGASTTRTFSPGVHQLYATTDAGAATFTDGSRTVVADPAPELPVVEVANGTVVSLDLQATDDFGNLQSLAVSVDGETVETHTTETVQSERTGHSLSTVEHLRDLKPGTHVVSVYARDARGQTVSATRTVEVPGPPEVVSAGFVQDGPLDQYHPRINESRYMATYRVVVDLNGVAPETIQSQIKIAHDGWKSPTIRKTNESNLVIRKDTYRKDVEPIIGQSVIHWRKPGEPLKKQSDSLDVTPAKPEIRISVVAPQPENTVRSGIRLDASKSFDPDGTKLEYDWYGVSGDHVEKPLVTLDSYDIARLEIIDGHNQRSIEESILGWFAPELAAVDVESNGPYYPDEKVVYSVSSEIFHYSKPSYEESTSFTLETEEGSVVDHQLLRGSDSEIDSPDAEPLSREHEWKVEIPAKAFVSNNEAVSVASYATEHPVVRYGAKLPEPRVYTQHSSNFRDIRTYVEYLVERPVYATRRTSDTVRKNALLESGYEIQKQTNTGLNYKLERRERIEEAEYDTQRRQFDYRGYRGFFLEQNPEWEAAGSSLETRTWTTTDVVWRSSPFGQGTYTGDSQLELVDQGVYRTEKQFRSHSGGTYWSTYPRSFADEYTGRTRQVTVQEPEYDRRYEFEVEQEHETQERVYLAERRVKVQSAEYEWRKYRTVSSRARAESAALAANIRIGGSSPAWEWTLEKQIGEEMTTVTYLKPDWKVLRTTGELNATWVREYILADGKITPDTDKRIINVDAKISKSGHISRKTIKDILEQKMREKYAE